MTIAYNTTNYTDSVLSMLQKNMFWNIMVIFLCIFLTLGIVYIFSKVIKKQEEKK